MNQKEFFGTCADGKPAYLYTIGNSAGMQAKISDFGGVVVSLFVRDRDGNMRDIVTGYDTLAEYEVNPPHFGALIGRCADRIKDGRFSMEGVEYRLDCNKGANHLHGGYKGFDKRLWNAWQTAGHCLTLTLFSADGDQHYPGNLNVCVVYTITEDNALCISYRGMSDKKTLFNMTNHTYFNLAGQEADSILDHKLCIRADAVTVVDESLCSTGQLLNVEGTPLDFRRMKKIGADIHSDHTQMKYTKGFDHNYVLSAGNGEAAAEAYCTESGIDMKVYTDMPGLQLYTGNYLTEALTMKGGRKAAPYRAFCLETQYFPDAINHPDFMPPTVEAGEYACHDTRFVFGVRNSDNEQ